MSCKQTTNTPINQEEDPCGGTHVSTECIVEPSALPELDLPANSTQQEVNLALQTGLYTVLNQDYRLLGYTVATLPASPSIGTMAYVTDADSPSYLANVIGGGSIFCPVIYNGTNWICH